ncbi:MAG: alpha-galactosidase [Spirochaetaceae bacterium]|jgi:alpha-galactosidase|nr:alpha-galactosidase [Spirochaetaceae bacterium]
MITVNDGVFRLASANTEYIFRLTKFGQPEHIYYGALLAPPDSVPDIEAIAPKCTAQQGGSIVAYNRDDPLYCLDTMCLEWSGIGKGDYRYSPSEIKMPDGGFVTDFVYESHSITRGPVPLKELPAARGTESECMSLELRLRDKVCDAALILIYTVFETTDVITRRVVLKNSGSRPLVIRRLLSMSLDMVNRGCTLITFDGDWAKEAHRHERPLQYGIFVNESRTGASGNKHNPGFLLCEDGANENSGRVYGFNLIYSGNHLGFVELSSRDLVRVGIGISPHCFEWTLNAGECFETPEAAMTFSETGLNGLSRNFHGFVNSHIIPETWQGKERPVLYNSWEPCFFKFNQRKLLRLARRAKNLGLELFVLDDGWFEGRDNDKAGLGDYEPSRRKFPRGLKPFARKVRKLGLDFGIWVEPEMVNEDSNLYRSHPEYAVRQDGREPSMGRNQLVLDLCNPAVRDYIVTSVGTILDETGAAYVKWDMNRHISEFQSGHIAAQGEFFHRYILGLYDILRRIFAPRPRILLESCSSGGNRFDLGMLCFSPQIWVSDNTDPAVRLNIQGGLSCLYPQSTMGAHVSDAPHQQTLRDTPLSTRYNVACFGCLGYEMDLRYLTPVEKREVKDQIAFYKAHRKTLQYGIFQRLAAPKTNKTIWLCRGTENAVAGFFQSTAGVCEGPDVLCIPGMDPGTHYRVSTRPQKLYIKRFGGLVKHILPVSLDPGGLILQTANRHYALTGCVETYDCRGSALQAGIMLNNQFMGSYYNDKTRLLGDYGSNLYTVTPLPAIQTAQ